MLKAGIIASAIVAGLLAFGALAFATDKGDTSCVANHDQTYTEPAIGHVGKGLFRACNVANLPVPPLPLP